MLINNTIKAHLLILLRGFFGVFALLSATFLTPSLFAQDAAEVAGATTMTSTVAASPKHSVLPNPIPSKSPAGRSSPHITSSNTDTVESNRQALESKAGPDAACLLLRSLPSQAQVWINNQQVGTTPQLLILPPGKYSIELRGSRQQTARKEIALLPKETQEITLKLELRYPTRVVLSH